MKIYKNITLILTLFEPEKIDLIYWSKIYKKNKDKINFNIVVDNPNADIKMLEKYFPKIYNNKHNVGKFNTIYNHIKENNVRTPYFKTLDPDDRISIKRLKKIKYDGPLAIIKFEGRFVNEDKTFKSQTMTNYLMRYKAKTVITKTTSTSTTIIPTNSILEDGYYKWDKKTIINAGEDVLLGTIAYANGYDIVQLNYYWYLYFEKKGLSSKESDFSDLSYINEMIYSIKKFISITEESKRFLKMWWPINLLENWSTKIKKDFNGKKDELILLQAEIEDLLKILYKLQNG